MVCALALRRAAVGSSLAVSEREKMIAGELYRPDDPELTADRDRCRRLLAALRSEPDPARQRELLQQLLGSIGEGASVVPPFACDYGYNIPLGAGSVLKLKSLFLHLPPVQ